MDALKKFIDTLGNEELWRLYSESESELKDRGLVRTRNITGERGEFLAIETYNSIAGLPNLQAAPEGTQNVDALSRKGERYSIKTITDPSSTTGVFYGCGEVGSDQAIPQKFEYVIVVQLFKNYMPKRIVELSWLEFLENRRWHSTMRAWNLSLTKKVLEKAKVIFEAD
jgi:hypothetical protein